MTDLPPDPFDRPPFVDGPVARSVLEAARLAVKFAEVGSLSALLENLRRAGRQEVELVAMLAVAGRVRDNIDAAADSNGDSQEAADERWFRWLVAAPIRELPE
jgi:hypothetical protein